jgi:RNA recognition motif-containing protein
MHKTIQIGNLGYSVDDHELARLFAPYGAVRSAKVATHSDTDQSTGVGFVEMESNAQAASAIAALNGRVHGDRILCVCWSSARVDQHAMSHEIFSSERHVAKPAGPHK